MKILRLSIDKLPHFKENLDISFIAQQRVADTDKEYLFNIFSNIYTNPALSFIGINASGKTTALKVFSFAIHLLNNESINNSDVKDIFDDLTTEQTVTFTSYFYHDCEIYKLATIIGKEVNPVDASERLIIHDEILWAKECRKIKTKKSIYDFNEAHIQMRRNREEQYLMDDVSIIIATNKKNRSNIFLCDMSQLTDHNLLNVLGKFPKALLRFLDPSIEYLHCKSDGKEVDIRLKFYGKDEIYINHPLALNHYLSSGTIKGLSVFMGAMLAFVEGGYLVVDELENHFNKEIVVTLIRFFMDKKINKNGATLLFSTHYSELLDQFDRNDNIFIVRNTEGIVLENLSNIIKRNDIKKSEVYDSDFLGGTVPLYESYIALKNVLMSVKHGGYDNG